MLQRMVGVSCLFLLLSATAAAQGGAAPWKQLLSLAGEWEGTEAGRTGTLKYVVVSAGSTLMETMKAQGEPEMITMYHRDGNALVATHYCSAGNQPRMRAEGGSPDGKSIRFRFTGITNLASPGAEHIRHLTVTFVDADHFTQEWTSMGDGKEQSAVFRWTRKK